LNAGLLKLLGRSVPAPFVQERLAALPSQLRNLECDVVLLQEIYGHSTRHWLAESLEDVFPYAIYPEKKRYWGLANGLMVLSRYVASGDVELFRYTPFDEALFDSKGIMFTQHELPGEIALTIMNIHTTAGGVLRHPEDKRIDEIRSRQIAQGLKRVARLPSPLIIAGDLNAGPGVSEVNFRQILDAGFVSVHDLFHDEISDVTWDPRNPLNSSGPHKACPRQRIDHIFIRTEDFRQNRMRPLSSVICLQTPVVQIEGGNFVTVSDHYGICVEIDVSSEALSDGTGEESDSAPAGQNPSKVIAGGRADHSRSILNTQGLTLLDSGE
jgi:endonuclease/exonuclease/phosphatase family metal-dependent hydrolase